MGRFERCGAKVEGTSPPHLPPRRRPLRSTRTAPPRLISSDLDAEWLERSTSVHSVDTLVPRVYRRRCRFPGFCPESGAEWLKLRGMVAPTFPCPVDTFVFRLYRRRHRFPRFCAESGAEWLERRGQVPRTSVHSVDTLVPRVYRRRCRFPGFCAESGAE
ncbi:hypothetical protein B0H13DRAFT_551226 [Mycena leptocephala]|nr:hypothetical protein B0H13DRAFT_551226 [Mycena leptocephala]